MLKYLAASTIVDHQDTILIAKMQHKSKDNYKLILLARAAYRVVKSLASATELCEDRLKSSTSMYRIGNVDFGPTCASNDFCYRRIFA